MSWTLPRRTPVAARTAAGIVGVRFPATGLTEIRRVLPECEGCTKTATHGPPSSGLLVVVPPPERRHQRVTATERISGDLWMRIYGWLNTLHQVANGLPTRELVFSRGLIRTVPFEIVSVSGSTLTVRGRNPKYLADATPVPNPDYPASGGPYLFDPGAHSLPAGSVVDFDWPSRCANVNPTVLAISPPESEDFDGVQYSVTLSQDVAQATAPLDAAFAPSVYTGAFRYYHPNSEQWTPNFQFQRETHFNRRSDSWIRSAAEMVDGLLPLLDHDGQETRIFPIDGLADEGNPTLSAAMMVLLTYADESEVFLSMQELAERVSTIQTGATTWETRLDISDYLDNENLDQIDITYWPEWNATENDGVLTIASGRCHNSQRSAYEHADGFRCTALDCTKFLRGDYEAECWSTANDASRFSLGYEGNAYRGEHFRLTTHNLNNQRTPSDFWIRTPLVLAQIAAGSPARTVRRPARGGPSILSIMGGFAEKVPSTLSAAEEPFDPPRHGQLRVYTDETGEHHELVFGAFIANYPQTVGGSIFLGAIPAEVTGWDSRDNALRVTRTAPESYYPTGLIGYQAMNGYNVAGIRQVWESRLSPGTEEKYATGLDTTAVDTEFRTQTGNRFGL